MRAGASRQHLCRGPMSNYLGAPVIIQHDLNLPATPRFDGSAHSLGVGLSHVKHRQITIGLSVAFFFFRNIKHSRYEMCHTGRLSCIKRPFRLIHPDYEWGINRCPRRQGKTIRWQKWLTLIMMTPTVWSPIHHFCGLSIKVNTRAHTYTQTHPSVDN